MTDLTGTIRATAEIAGRRGRIDLAERLRLAERHRADARVRVVVVGDYKSGKSSLVNALVGAGACPVDDDLATAVMTAISYGDAPAALVTFQGQDRDQRPPKSLALDELAGAIEKGTHDGHPVASVAVSVPAPFLAGGLELMDTPVLGGLDSPEAVATLMGLPYADALLFASDTSQEYTGPELEYLRQACGSGTQVICVMTKIDLHPQWRRILEIDEGHLRNAGFELAILPTSARLHELSSEFRDEGYAVESGIPALREYVIREVVAPAIARHDQSAMAEVVGVLDQLESVLRAEQTALAADVAGPSLDDLRASDRRAAELLADSARWRQHLSDGVEDLGNDVAHQLQVGVRDLLRAASEMVDAGDPISMEEEYSNWVSRRAAAIVSDCFQVISRRGKELADRVVGELASSTEGLLVPLDVALSTEQADQLSFASHASSGDDDEDKVLTALGGAWTGMEPLIGVAALVGISTGIGALFLLPVAGVVGVLTVGRAFRQERRKALGAERDRAKEEYREYLDEVAVRFTKGLDDAVRSLYRELRDGATIRLAEFQRSTRAALEATERAPTVDDAARAGEVAELGRELDAVATLRAQARGEVRATLVASPTTEGEVPANG